MEKIIKVCVVGGVGFLGLAAWMTQSAFSNAPDAAASDVTYLFNPQSLSILAPVALAGITFLAIGALMHRWKHHWGM